MECEIGIEWYKWYVTLIEWSRIIQLHLLLALLFPNTLIILNWLVDGTGVCNWSHTSSIVNWSSNSPFKCMILPSISFNTYINRSNRWIIGIHISFTVLISLISGSSMIIVVSELLFWLAISNQMIVPTMNTLESLDNFEWYQSHSIHRTKQGI